MADGQGRAGGRWMQRTSCRGWKASTSGAADTATRWHPYCGICAPHPGDGSPRCAACWCWLRIPTSLRACYSRATTGEPPAPTSHATHPLLAARRMRPQLYHRRATAALLCLRACGQLDAAGMPACICSRLVHVLDSCRDLGISGSRDLAHVGASGGWGCRAAPLVLYARECDEEHEVEVLLGVSRHMRNSTYFLGVAAGMDRRAAATGW